jgi:hypothetical protein
MSHALLAGVPAARKLNQVVTIVGPVVTQTVAATTTCTLQTTGCCSGCYCYAPPDQGIYSSSCSIKTDQDAKTIQIVKIPGFNQATCNIGKLYWAYGKCLMNIFV